VNRWCFFYDREIQTEPSWIIRARANNPHWFAHSRYWHAVFLHKRSRMTRKCQIRFCEKLRRRFINSTRHVHTKNTAIQRSLNNQDLPPFIFTNAAGLGICLKTLLHQDQVYLFDFHLNSLYRLSLKRPS